MDPVEGAHQHQLPRRHTRRRGVSHARRSRRFCREVTGLIVDWVNESEPDTAWWEGSVLHVRGGDRSYINRLEPDDLGLYSFDGWVWLVLQGQMYGRASLTCDDASPVFPATRHFSSI